MGSITFEILLIFVLIVANGLFSMSEAAVVASRKARLLQAAQSGDSKAKAALALAENPTIFLSTVQIGITLIGILSGAFGGASLAKSIAGGVATVPLLAPYADSIGLGIVVFAITFFSLVVGELVPKRLAMAAPEKIAGLVAKPMSYLSFFTAPFVWLLTGTSDLLLRLIGMKASTEPPVTEEEIKVMVDQGTQAGVFDHREQDIIERVFLLGDRRVGSLMTPRAEIVWVDKAAPAEVNRRIIAKGHYSRVIVCKGNLDYVVGVLHAKDLITDCYGEASDDLFATLQSPVYVPETMPALRLLETMNAQRTHLVLVVDEHGGTQGMVTLHDLLSAMVGTLPQVDASDEPYVTHREDGSLLFDGAIPLEELKSYLQLDELPGESQGRFTTLGGFLMMGMDRIPTEGDVLEAAHWKFEVVDMDGQRIDKVLASFLERVESERQSGISSTS